MKDISLVKHRLAIIGASSGQLPLVKKAKEMGIYTVCFAWDKDAVCKNVCDLFCPISIFETDEIVAKCKELGINGVTSNASEETSKVASLIADKLHLNTTNPEVIEKIQNKAAVRSLTSEVIGLSVPKVWREKDIDNIEYPCVVKPVKGSAKKGVSYCKSPNDLSDAIDYARSTGNNIIVEEYIDGREYSVEALSFHGKHQIVQITDKKTSGYPHFVELEHHQPADISHDLRIKIEEVAIDILMKVGYSDGASHIEMKVNKNGIYLIEINPRGGGDRISDTLVGLSTDCDYLSAIIDIALNRYQFKPIRNISYCGILFLSYQNNRILKYFDGNDEDWLVEKKRINGQLTVSSSNYDRDGYIIYKSKNRISL